MATLLTPFYQAGDANGLPLPGATLAIFEAGTSTPVTIYQDEGATTPHTNPVVASAAGIFPAMFLNVGDYKTVLKDAGGVTIQTIDGFNVPAPAVLADGDKGDVTVTGSGSVWALNVGSVVAATITSVAAGLAAIGFKLGLITNGNMTVEVDPTGNDTTGDGSGGAPYATWQKAWDSLPWIIKDKVVINIANGTYSTSSRLVASMDRPALLYLDGKKIGRRTDAPGGVMTGGVVFIGESEAGVILQPGSASGYTRGIYQTGHVGSVGFQNFTIDALTGAEAGIVAHRGAYSHVSDVTIDGNTFMTFGIVAEAGGFLEALGMDIHHCAIGVQSYQASTVGVSLSSTIHDCSSLGVSQGNGGYVSLTIGTTCSSNIIVPSGARLDTTGISSSRVTVSGTLQVRGGTWAAAFTDVTGTITTYPGAEVSGGATGWSGSWIDYGAGGYLPGVVSWVSPATQSTVATPLAHINGIDNFYKDATFQIINSSGTEVAETMNGSAAAVTASGTAITSTIRNNLVNTTTLTATANRTGCTLPAAAMPGRISTAPVPPGTVWHILGGSSFTIELVPGTTADFMGLTSITIGTGAGAYGGVEAIMGATGLWRVFPKGAVRV